jgi:hypothetical protein
MKNTDGEKIWRYVLRYAGLLAFTLSCILLILGTEVPLWLPLTAAGMMGLDSIQGFEQRKQRGE